MARTVRMGGPVVVADPRPLRGEPLALDLVNTRWMAADGRQDLLVDEAGLAVWLRGSGLDGICSANASTLEALRHTRDALLAVLADPTRSVAVDTVLDHGRIRRRLIDGVPTDEVEIDDPAWRVGWLAADNYVGLATTGIERIRGCASSACILYFYDTSKNGTRRWCSMAACGNRAKAARHYVRVREGHGSAATTGVGGSPDL